MSFTLKKETPEVIKQKIKSLEQRYARQVLGLQLGSCYTKEVNNNFPIPFVYSVYQSIDDYQVNAFCFREQILQEERSRKVPTNLLRLISGINFIDLRRLNLSNSSLVSIQQISWMNLPQITQISIDSNKISSIYPLSKTKFSNLKVLSVSSNLFSHQSLKQSASRIKVNEQQFRQLNLIRQKTGFNDWNDNGFVDKQQLYYTLYLSQLTKFSALRVKEKISIYYRYRRLKIPKIISQQIKQKFGKNQLFQPGQI